MDLSGDIPLLDRGVGATAEAHLVPLTPLIEYYEREMGDLAGRLMIAASFLSDAQLVGDWTSQPPEVRQMIEQSQALVVSVMVRILNAQGGCDCGGESQVAGVESLLDRF